MSSIFTKIVNGEIPCYKVAEDEKHLAFLDITPIKKGHVLVIPKNEIDNIFDIKDSDLGELIIFAKKVSKKLIQVFPSKKIGMTVIGLEVAHAHIHLIPINSISDMDFSKEKLKLSEEEFIEISNKIFIQ